MLGGHLHHRATEVPYTGVIVQLNKAQWWCQTDVQSEFNSLQRDSFFLIKIFLERHVLFNDALNTFHLQVYGVRHMVKNHSYSKRENLLLPNGLLFQISSKTSFIYIILQTGIHIPWPLLQQLCNSSMGPP